MPCEGEHIAIDPYQSTDWGGIGVLNLGHCHPRVVEAIRDQATRLTHYAFNAAPHAPYIELMDRLTAFIPVDYPVSGMR